MELAQEVRTRVYRFGNKTADGNSKMKNLLGGKGANLAEMNYVSCSPFRIPIARVASAQAAIKASL